MLGIYVHVPFCESKCNYCAFASFVQKKEIQKKYFKFLIDEINNFNLASDSIVDSIFIGGGTPSCVDVCYIETIMSAIKNKFKILKDAEITIEANPNSLNLEKLKIYRKLGINRLSIGVQSLNNNQLKKIGRLHNKKQVFDALKFAKKAGFENINCDFLLGLENSSYFKIKNMLRKIKNKVTHFSCYMLQVENGTLLEKMCKEKKIVLPDEDKTVKIYEKISNYLQKKKFFRYEISNFAKEGYQCLHNIKYWRRDNYLGFGLSAHSLFNNKRWANASNFDDYFKNKKPYEELLTNQQIIEEIIMLGLRCEIGFNKKQILDLGYDIEKNENFNNLINKNILIEKGDIIKTNPKYYGVSNYIISSIL